MGVLDGLAAMIGSSLLESMADQIRAETMVDDRTLVLKDGSMMSMISLSGCYRGVGEAEFADMIERMRIGLAAYFSDPGHVIEVNFLRDPVAARRFLERIVNRSRRAARGLSMDIDDLLSERVSNLSRFMVSESCLLTLYTRPQALTAEEARDDVALIRKRTSKVLPMPDAQIPGKFMETLHARHESYVDAVMTSMGSAGQKVDRLSVRQALQEIRAGLIPDSYPHREEWSPILPAWSTEAGEDSHPGQRALIMAPATARQMAMQDYANFGVPGFHLQLADMESFIENSRVVRIGNSVFLSFDMTIAPEVLPDFNDLVTDITEKSRDMPWRSSLRMEAGGVQAQKIKNTILSIISWAAPQHNRRIRDAILLNEDIHGRDDTVVKMRMTFTTWAPAGDMLTLRRNAQTLSGAVKRWGNCGVDGVSGDPLATTLAALPGVTTASTAPVASGPMRDILSMMPFSRQASPWDSGAVLFRTTSGKPWPYQPGSSKQTTWITLLVGTPGSGKSVAMNAINFAAAISPSAGGDEPVLPRIAIIDIGPSSSGLISLIQESLPAKKRHEVMFQKLRMDRSHAINVFDTQLGMRRPLSLERTFLINFLTLICGDGERPPSNAMRGLITATIDRAYEEFADDRNPRRYTRGDILLVDDALAETGFMESHETIWWEVVDHLMRAGRLHEAEIAQRMAVPTLQDLVTASNADQIVSLYGTAMDAETGQGILSSFRRMISEVVRDYPILGSATRYSIGAARIVSMDLMDVTARGAGPAARKQTAIMYMLARQVITRDFFIDESEVVSMVKTGALPPEYKAYHVERARMNLQIPKIICMDEFHRCGSIAAVTDQVLQDAREGRKFNIDIKCASQLIEDFPPQIIEVASSILVCNAGSENSINYMDDMFRLTENEKRIMRYNLTGPSTRGAPLWALFRTKEGQVRQDLVLTLGPTELWAFSTTAEDVAIRAMLYEIVGPRMARQVLAARFPGGSAKAEIEARMVRLEERGERVDDAGRSNIIADLADELKQQAYALSSLEGIS